MPNIQRISNFLEQTSLFNNLPSEAIHEIAAASTLKTFEAKQSIFLEGDEGAYSYVVHSGRIAMIKSSLNGREMIVELLPAGEAFGIVVVVEQRTYPLSARAQSESEVIAIPRSIIKQLTQKYPQILQDVLKIVSTRLQSSHNISRAIAHDSVELRIAATLVALISKMDTAESKTIFIGRQELADLVGTTIETASRVCKQLEKDGILDLKTVGKLVVTDFSALQQITNEHCR